MERLGAIILRIGAAGSVTINPANLSTMKIYGQSKRRQDLARLPEGARGQEPIK